jgi:hypothetical protein
MRKIARTVGAGLLVAGLLGAFRGGVAHAAFTCDQVGGIAICKDVRLAGAYVYVDLGDQIAYVLVSKSPPTVAVATANAERFTMVFATCVKGKLNVWYGINAAQAKHRKLPVSCPA